MTKPDHGTPETRAKLQADPLWTQALAGYLWKEHLEAALAIEQGYLALVAPTNLRMMRFEERGHDWMPHNVSQALTKHAAAMIELFERWSEIWEDGGNPIMPVIEIVVDRRSWAEVDRRFGKYNGWSKRFVRNGLHEYARMMGWVSEKSSCESSGKRYDSASSNNCVLPVRRAS